VGLGDDEAVPRGVWAKAELCVGIHVEARRRPCEDRRYHRSCAGREKTIMHLRPVLWAALTVATLVVPEAASAGEGTRFHYRTVDFPGFFSTCSVNGLNAPSSSPIHHGGAQGLLAVAGAEADPYLPAVGAAEQLAGLPTR
jgi:hypothetical protein